MNTRGSVRRERLTKALASGCSIHDERVAWLRGLTASVRLRCDIDAELTPTGASEWVANQVRAQAIAGDQVCLYLPKPDPVIDALQRELIESANSDRNEQTMRRRATVSSSDNLWMVRAFVGPGFHSALDCDLVRADVFALRSEADLMFTRQPLARVALAVAAAEKLLLCSPTAALWFVLCDRVPEFRAARVEEVISYPTLPGALRYADPWLAAEDVATMLVDERAGGVSEHVVARRRPKRPEARLDELITFVEARRPVKGRSAASNMTWEHVFAEWNGGDRYMYPHAVAMEKAYHRAVKTRKGKGLRKPEGEKAP